MEYFFIQIILEILKPIGRFITRFAILPVYRILVINKLRFQRLTMPARGLLIMGITNKYLLHITVLGAGLFVIAGNLQTRQVLAQDAGQASLLYDLMTNGSSEVVHEDVYLNDIQPSVTLYGAGTIEALPHIDFDYQIQDDDTIGLNDNMPGTVALQPLKETDTANRPRAVRNSIENYTVKTGDTLGTIARDFDIDVGTILWANNLSERQYIRPGDTLKILPVSGVVATIKKGDTLSAIAKRYSVSTDEIMRSNQLDSEIVPVGRELIIPGGIPPVIEQNRIIAKSRVVTRETLAEPGISKTTGEHNVVQGDVKKPADKTEATEAPKTKLLWPTSGRVITQYYNWRHVGLDIDGDLTSPLYASADGVISTAGWNNGGYGLQVLITHDNGMKTRYAHASKLFVKSGDTVKRGQVIAMMGSTGRSTGSHLHYEVYVDGKRVNPLLYIK